MCGRMFIYPYVETDFMVDLTELTPIIGAYLAGILTVIIASWALNRAVMREVNRRNGERGRASKKASSDAAAELGQAVLEGWFNGEVKTFDDVKAIAKKHPAAAGALVEEATKKGLNIDF